MAKPEWGLKRRCRECGKRFYDFHRDPIVCPGCQAVFDPLAALRPRRSRAAAAPAAAPSKPVAEAEPDETGEDDDAREDDAVIDSEDDDGMIESDTDLEDDDISDVVADEEE